MKSKIFIAICFIVIVAVMFQFGSKSRESEFREKEKALKQKYDSLKQQLTEQRRRVNILNNSLDSIRLLDMANTRSIDSLQLVINKYKNPYKNKSNEELANLMNSRAR